MIGRIHIGVGLCDKGTHQTSPLLTNTDFEIDDPDQFPIKKYKCLLNAIYFYIKFWIRFFINLEI